MPDFGPECWRTTEKSERCAAEQYLLEGAESRRTTEKPVIKGGDGQRCGVVVSSFLAIERKLCGEMKKYTKEEAIKIVTSCAEKYADELANRTLLFVCVDKKNKISCFEFAFYPWNYMHLTGLKVRRKSLAAEEDANEIAAVDFYNRCLAHRLSPRDFEFADDGTTHMKLDVLEAVLNKNLSARMIGDYNSAKPKLYTERLAGGTKACLGFLVDKMSGQYVPNTVLNEDIRKYVTNYVRVVAVYRKEVGEGQYEEVTYRAKDINWADIQYPDRYDYLSEKDKDDN